LPSIGALENAFRSANLAERISDKLNVALNAETHE
jgi:hypothetical protein